MEHEFFTFDTLPRSLKMIGDNISHLRYVKIRDVVNDELSQCRQGVRIDFNVNEQDQITTTFYSDDIKLGDPVVIRSNSLEKLVQEINNEYLKMTTKKEKIMKKKVKKATDVAAVSNEVISASSVSSESKSEMSETELLANFVSEHYAGSGCYYDVEKFLDVPRLFHEKTNGAVVSIIMNDANFTIVGINNFTMTCSVKGVNLETLRKQVGLMLHTAIDYQQKFADMTGVWPISTDSVAEETIAEETEYTIRKETKPRSASHKNSQKVVEKYNKAVYYKTADLEEKLKGKCSSSSSQTIRKRLYVLAVESGLKTKDMSGRSLVSELNQDNRDLLRELCLSAQCEIPSFLSESSLNQKVGMKG